MTVLDQPQATDLAVQPQPGENLVNLMLRQWEHKVVPAMKPEDAEEEAWAKTLLEAYVRRLVHELDEQGQVVSTYAEDNIKYWITAIDQVLSDQINEVMHDPEFQRLEATWRGLHYLVDQTETGDTLKLRVLNVTKRDLFKDLERAPEFDQSALFKKVYEDEYGVLGGEPYGLLVGDYEFGRHPEDISLLKRVCQVASAAHAPFVAAASPKLFNLDRFTELTAPRDLARIFQGVEFAAWKSFRESEDSRYAALALPHVLGRLPYGQDFTRVDEFQFEETVNGKDHDRYLWMNAAWAYAARVTSAFANYGWFARTQGVAAGGKVEGLPVHTFPTDEGDIAMKCPTEIAIPDRREGELSGLGFLPLLHCKGRDFAAFVGAQSCQKPKTFFSAEANDSAQLSAQFNLLLCVSRFAHYLKVMARDKIGSFMTAQEGERWLNEWIQNYVLASPETCGEELKARFPLADARVEVRPIKSRPGRYEAVAFLQPHFQLQALKVSLRLVATVPTRT